MNYTISNILTAILIHLALNLSAKTDNTVDSLKYIINKSSDKSKVATARNQLIRKIYKTDYQTCVKLISDNIDEITESKRCLEIQKGESYYLRLRVIHRKLSLADRIAAADSAMVYWGRHRVDEEYMQVILIKSGLQLNNGSVNESNKTIRDGILLAQKHSLKDMIPRLSGTLASNYMQTNKCDSALILLDDVEKYYVKNSNPKFAYGVMMLKASCYAEQQQIQRSIVTFLRSIEYGTKHKLSPKRLLNTYINLAGMYTKVDEYDKSEIYYKKSINIAKEIGDNEWEAICHAGIGTLYHKQSRLSKAKHHLNKSIEINKTLKSKVNEIETNNSLSQIYISEKNYEKAKYFILKTINQAKLYKDVSKEISCSINLAKIHYKTNNRQRALQLSHRANKLAEENNKVYLKMKAVKNLCILYKQQNIKHTNRLLEEYIILKDSIFSIEKQKAINTLEIKYKTAEKESQIKVLNLENKNQKLEISKSAQDNLIISGAFVFFVLLLIPISFWVRQHNKNRLLEERLRSETNECTRIAKDLHDGVSGSLSHLKQILKTENISDNLIEYVEKVSSEVRGISHKLNMSALSKQDFQMALQSSLMLDHFPESINLKITIQKNFDITSYSKKTNLIRIVQELVNNSLKHSEAEDIEINFALNNKNITLEYYDNGCGFDIQTVKHGTGLHNIRDRVRLM